MLVKCISGGRDCVNDYQPRRNFLSSDAHAAHGIAKQEAAQSFALPFLINRETPKQHGGYLTRHISAHTARNIGGEYLSHADRIISDDERAFWRTDHISFGGCAFHIPHRALSQPIIQNRLGGMERGEIVIFGQRGRGGETRKIFSHDPAVIKDRGGASCPLFQHRLRAYPSSQARH